MKILIVVQNYYPSVGGTQIFFQTVAERLVSEYGDEVDVFTCNSYFGPEKKAFKKAVPETEIINGVRVRRFDYLRAHLFLGPFVKKLCRALFGRVPERIVRIFYGPVSSSLAKAIDVSNADVILTGTYNYYYTFLISEKWKHTRMKPFVFQGAIHFGESESVNELMNCTIDVIQNCNYYAANTLFEKKKLMALGIAEKKIDVIGICVDATLFANGNRNIFRDLFLLSSSEKLFGYIGRIEPTKNLETLLKAFEACCEESHDASLVIAGKANTDYLEKLKALCDQLPKQVSNKIHFLDSLDVQQRTDLFYAIDIFVSPSLNESFGMTFLEAWCCKKPVIGMRIGAISSVIEEGVDGLLSDQKGYQDLAAKMLLLLRNESVCFTLGANGFTKVEYTYSIAVITEKYRNLLLQAIASTD